MLWNIVSVETNTCCEVKLNNRYKKNGSYSSVFLFLLAQDFEAFRIIEAIQEKCISCQRDFEHSDDTHWVAARCATEALSAVHVRIVWAGGCPVVVALCMIEH